MAGPGYVEGRPRLPTDPLVAIAPESKSLWLDEALAEGEAPAPPLEGHARADVCIVGGGYTGLWTALRVKDLEPSAEVVLLEADVCGAGASGRNGGFVLTWWSKFGTLRKLYGADEALRVARAAAAALPALGEFCAANGIDAHFRPDGWLWAATSPAQRGAWSPVIAELEDLGERPFVELDGAETARRAGSDRYLAGVLEPTSATVQPALLARGLRRVALDRGIRIHERSPVRRLERSRPLVVRCDAGEVVADRVVVATGAWAIAVRGLRRVLVVVSSDIVATERSPERLHDVGLDSGLCISDARLLVHYHRSTLDGRIVFGKGGARLAFGTRVGESFDGPSPSAATVERHLRLLYPRLGLAVVRSWTGPVDRSHTGLPFFTRVGGRDDLVAGAGFSGNGVGPSWVGGRVLASLALGLDDEWASLPLVGDPAKSFPPEPIRYVGGRVVRAAVARVEQAEDGGRRPSRVAIAVARLAPAGLVPLKSRL